MTPSKRCSRCKVTKPLSEFASNLGRADRKDYYCLLCRRAANAAWSASHREQINLSRRGRTVPASVATEAHYEDVPVYVVENGVWTLVDMLRPGGGR